MTDHTVSLETLYDRFDAYADGRDHGRGGWAAHEAVLDRLADNRRAAESRGWTACALERAGGMGRLRAFGVPPTATERQQLPDWPAELA